jgi:hypothetical protein
VVGHYRGWRWPMAGHACMADPMRFSDLAGRSILRFFSAGSRQQIPDQEISQPAGSSPLPLKSTPPAGPGACMLPLPGTASRRPREVAMSVRRALGRSAVVLGARRRPSPRAMPCHPCARCRHAQQWGGPWGRGSRGGLWLGVVLQQHAWGLGQG